MAKWQHVVSGKTVAARSRGIGMRVCYLTTRLARRIGLSLALLVVICTGTLAQLATAGIGLAPVASAHAATQPGKNTYVRDVVEDFVSCQPAFVVQQLSSWGRRRQVTPPQHHPN